MFIINKEMIYMRAEDIVTKGINRTVYRIYAGMKGNYRESTKYYLDKNNTQIIKKFISFITWDKQYQNEVDLFYDSFLDKYYRIVNIKPYSTYYVKGYCILDLEEYSYGGH
jgi:hypothetical protein